jgi:ABC-type sugar transport system substrate-binding protein
MTSPASSRPRWNSGAPKKLLALLALGVAAVAMTSAQASAGGSKVIVLIPKQTGDPFFANARQGAEEAAKQLGYTIKYLGPATADASGQVSTIQNVTQTHPAAIMISADDPNAVAPALNAATKAGVLVTSFNADVAPSARKLFINQASNEGIADAIADTMAAQTGGKGHFLLVTSTATAPNQNLWNKLAKAYMAKKYPNMHIDTIIPGNDDPATVLSVVTSYLAAHKASTTGIIVTGGGMSGAVKAEQQSGVDPHKVPVAGLCIPSDVKADIHAGLIKNCLLWSPADTAYANVYAINAYLNHTFKPNGTLKAGKLGNLQVANNVVNVGKPTIFTKANIDNFDF